MKTTNSQVTCPVCLKQIIIGIVPNWALSQAHVAAIFAAAREKGLMSEKWQEDQLRALAQIGIRNCKTAMWQELIEQDKQDSEKPKHNRQVFAGKKRKFDGKR